MRRPARVIDSRQLETLPSGGRSAFLFAVTVPTVVASGDPQFNRQQDQTNASLLSLGGGTRRGNNYLVDGVPITDMRNRASANPTIEAIEGVNVQVHQYDAETGRTGGGTFNVATKSGGNDWHGSGFYQTGRSGAWPTTSSRHSPACRCPTPTSTSAAAASAARSCRNRTFFWFATEGYGSNTTRNGALRVPTAREKAGDFSQSLRQRRPPGRDLRPADGRSRNRQRPSAVRRTTSFRRTASIRSRVKMSATCRIRRRDVSNGSINFNSTAEINDRADDVYRQGGSPLHRQGVVERLLSLQQDQRAVRELLRARPRGTEPLRRSARLHPAAPCSSAGVEQHLAAEQQHRVDASAMA